MVKRKTTRKKTLFEVKQIARSGYDGGNQTTTRYIDQKTFNQIKKENTLINKLPKNFRPPKKLSIRKTGKKKVVTGIRAYF
jgi:hypothetical protein|tara:strand:- start:3288 stop:3530 length:243 start_codon:yes stop_codon:yes gene_type:complete